MKDLRIKPIKIPAGYQHPPPPNDILPAHEFTMGIIAPKGAGKTTVICNLLNFYGGYYHTILVFSPTVQSDEKWDVIKATKLTVENTRLKKWRQDLLEKEQNNTAVRNGNKGGELAALIDAQPVHTGYIEEEHFFDDYQEDRFMAIMDEQLAMIKLLKKHGKPKFWANRILIIFDDLVGSALFAGSRGSYFKGVNTRHRHYSASFIMVSQGYKEIPKTIRTQWSALLVFEIGNEKEVEVIYEEFPMGLRRNDWLDMYKYATKEEHSFLFLNFQKPREYRKMKNFLEYLTIQ